MRGRTALSLAQQLYQLQRHDRAGSGHLDARGLDWRFDAQPSPLARRYRVRLYMPRSGSPMVQVTAPNVLELAEGRALPHVYSSRPVRLCLYMPGTGEWHSGRRAAETLVPWSFLWLAYFEAWLISGEWCGGGEHPPGPEDQKAGAPEARKRRGVHGGC